MHVACRDCRTLCASCRSNTKQQTGRIDPPSHVSHPNRTLRVCRFHFKCCRPLAVGRTDFINVTQTAQNAGFMTIAYGSVGYAEMAIDMALSLRPWNAGPIVLAADPENIEHVRNLAPKVFDDIVVLPARYGANGRTSKFGLGEVTPFAHTVFIDADTLIVADPRPILEHAQATEFLMMGKYMTSETSEKHHDFSVQGLIEAFSLQTYFRNHSGAFGFERAYGRRFLSQCYETYVNRLYTVERRLKGFVGDELAFGVVGGQMPLSIMRQPFPVYWPDELIALEVGRYPKPFCHFIAPIAAGTLDTLMAEVGTRREQHGIAGNSTKIWRQKAAPKPVKPRQTPLDMLKRTISNALRTR